MPLRLLLQNSAFEPSEVEALVGAFDRVCHELKLKQTDDPTRELVARKILELAEGGARDPNLISASALAEVRKITIDHEMRSANIAPNSVSDDSLGAG